jgi:hypothetical protein
MYDAQDILDAAANSEYDFRRVANPDDPLKHLFNEWVPYYRLKWAIARVLQPRMILEIGVRFGYSAATFLDACPAAAYLGIDNDSDTFGAQRDAIRWARHITRGTNAEYLMVDSQQLHELPGGPYDLIHIGTQKDGEGSVQQFRNSNQAKPRLAAAGPVLGYFR